MLDVFITVDLEIWCDGWNDLEARFPEAFKRYVYGPTARGDYGLPYLVKGLEEHGLSGVFFVEALFATCFGTAALSEIVDLLRRGGQEVQLHLHTEWVDESPDPVVPGTGAKRQHLRNFSLEDQRRLIAAGLALLEAAGGGRANAFRAGNFGFNEDTLKALAAEGIAFDSSYNASMPSADGGLMPGTILLEPLAVHGVHEYPVTVFRDGVGRMRPAQLTACSFRELESILWQALEAERGAFVILTHNFELLNAAKTRPDEVVVRRFDALCRFLDRHRDSFRVRGFRSLEAAADRPQPAPLSSSTWSTGLRILEQLRRRRYA